MKVKFLILTIVITLFSAVAAQQKINENLRQELLAMETEDQAARRECKGTSDEQIECYKKIGETIDAKNTKRLNEIFDRFGFPGVRLVGKDGFKAYLLVLQHTIGDELRVKSLKPIEQAFKRKEIPAHDYANFVDRLRLHQGKPQLYGQGFSFNSEGKMVMDAVVDPKNLDKRRKKIGLLPIAEYVKGLEEVYKLKVEMPKVY